MTRLAVSDLAIPVSAALQVPDTVVVGSPFDVTVVTHGSGCVRAGGTEVQVTGMVATVTPYDMLYRFTCASVVQREARAVFVRFETAGTATVRAVGANGTVVERSVVVRPAPLP